MATATQFPETGEVSDLVQYREGIEALFALKSSKPISNSEPAHAGILLQLFFRHAREHVRILCRKLSKVVFDSPDLVRQARNALRRGITIAVITQEEAEQSAFLDLLRDSGGLLLASSDPGISGLRRNFAVMDAEAIRFESDRDSCKATAIMHAPELASELVRLFDELALQVKLKQQLAAK